MKIRYDPQLIERVKKLDVRIRKSFRERMELFRQDPFTPQLHNHPLKREYKGYRIINITADMNNFKIIFIHGYTASHLADWYPNISRELDRLGLDYAIPDLPGGAYPHAREWLDALHGVISQTDKPLVLVGHSLGTRAALLYLEKYKPKVEKVFLIAAFANDTENANRRDDETYPDFFQHKIAIEVIKPLGKKFIVMHSRDDSSIKYEQGVEIARDLGAELMLYDDRDHFSAPENAGIILKELRKELHF